MVRRFEYIGGSSSKFWEIDQDGPAVSVRFGRIGTNGQQQFKDLGTEIAAEAQVAKLIAEKVKKGYVEVAAEPSTVAPAKQIAPAAVQPPARSVRDAPSDEDELVFPPSWRRVLHPRRGGIPVSPVKLDPAAHANVQWLMDDEGAGRRILDDPRTDWRYVEAARDDAAPSPLGAAILQRVTMAYADRDLLDRAAVAFPDDWIAAHGLEFAVRAVAELTGIFLDSGGRYRGAFLRPITDADTAGPWWAAHGWEYLAPRVRWHLATAPDADYANAVAALADYRNGSIYQRLVTSYLGPTELDWVADDVAYIAAGTSQVSPLVYAAVNSMKQVRAVAPHVRSWWHGASWGILVSLADGVGPSIAPLLMEWFGAEYTDADSKKRLVEVLAALPTDEAFGLLLDHLDDRYVQPAVLDAAKRFPARAMRLLAERAGPRNVGGIAAELLRGHARSHPEIVAAVRPQLTAAAAARVEAIAPADVPPEAAAADLPEVLTAPPWIKRRARQTQVVLEGLAAPTGAALQWEPGERKEWRPLPDGWRGSFLHYRREFNFPDLAAELRAGHEFYDLEDVYFYVHGPEALVRPLLASQRPQVLWYGADWIKRVVAKYELEALPFVLGGARAKPSSCAYLLMPYMSTEIAHLMADWAVRLKTVRPVADLWFARHAADAARALVPSALGKPGAERRNAEAALRRIASSGKRDAITEAAAGYGPAAADAIDALLDTDPIDVLPPRMPALPSWLDVAGLPPVLTTDRAHTLPTAAAGHLLIMLAISKPDEVYAGVQPAIAACDPASLAEFGWAVFARWMASGFPSKDGWVLYGLGLLGDDETVRRLSPLIRAWPGEGGHKRAVNALDVLAAIGTDVALMHLHGISQKVKFQALRQEAVGKVNQIAAELGLTADELADRLVPDFGLDPDGTMRLDYGPRQFVVGFDEQLKPYVTENGVRRRDLPRPSSKDDAELAPAAHRKFAGLRKDVRTIASDQIRRLEVAMVNQRRWTAEQFQNFFVAHPLLVHLARRLVWGCYGPGTTTWFRVAEDRSLADVNDDVYGLPADASIGIAHPLHMDGAVAAWTTVFADYEILQPFEQLARDVLVPTDQERGQSAITRFDGCKVRTVKILSLEHRGWRRAWPQEGGAQIWFGRRIPGGGFVSVGVYPGMAPGMANEPGFDVQTIDGVGVGGDPDRHERETGVPNTWGELDPVFASEVLRDLTWLTG